MFNNLNFPKTGLEYPYSKKLSVKVGIMKKRTTFVGKYPKSPTKLVIKNIEGASNIMSAKNLMRDFYGEV